MFFDESQAQKTRSISAKRDVTPATPALSSVTPMSIYDGVKLIKPSSPNSKTIKLQIGQPAKAGTKAIVDGNASIGGKTELDWVNLGDSGIKIRGSAELELGMEIGFDYSLFSGLQSFKSIPYVKLKDEVELSADGVLNSVDLKQACKRLWPSDERKDCKFKLKTIALKPCLLYTSPSPRDGLLSRMPSSA